MSDTKLWDIFGAEVENIGQLVNIQVFDTKDGVTQSNTQRTYVGKLMAYYHDNTKFSFRLDGINQWHHIEHDRKHIEIFRAG
jgi:hypothetical protein